MNLKQIPYNIWDDYWDDGFAPAGEIQETYAYVEEHNVLTEEQKEAISKFVFDHLQTLDLTGVVVKLRGEDIEFKNLTHVRREKLLAELRAARLVYEGIPFSFYSES